jgi:pantetheine-phosphate adenylyltransferase
MSAALNNRVAVYTGTFDPVHNGHLDVIARGSRLFDRLIVGVGNNPEKAPFFTLDERVALVRQVLAPIANTSVQPFEGLAVSFVRSVGARVMLRGLRTTSDMESEFTMSLMNRNLDHDIETIFLMATDSFSHLSSALLRQIASFGGELSNFVPAAIASALMERVRERQV